MAYPCSLNLFGKLTTYLGSFRRNIVGGGTVHHVLITTASIAKNVLYNKRGALLYVIPTYQRSIPYPT